LTRVWPGRYSRWTLIGGRLKNQVRASADCERSARIRVMRTLVPPWKESVQVLRADLLASGRRLRPAEGERRPRRSGLVGPRSRCHTAIDRGSSRSATRRCRGAAPSRPEGSVVAAVRGPVPHEARREMVKEAKFFARSGRRRRPRAGCDDGPVPRRPFAGNATERRGRDADRRMACSSAGHQLDREKIEPLADGTPR